MVIILSTEWLPSYQNHIIKYILMSKHFIWSCLKFSILPLLLRSRKINLNHSTNLVKLPTIANLQTFVNIMKKLFMQCRIKLSAVSLCMLEEHPTSWINNFWAHVIFIVELSRRCMLLLRPFSSFSKHNWNLLFKK